MYSAFQCNTLQHAATHCNILQHTPYLKLINPGDWPLVSDQVQIGGVLQCVAACCSMLQCVAACLSAFRCMYKCVYQHTHVPMCVHTCMCVCICVYIYEHAVRIEGSVEGGVEMRSYT